MINFIVCEDMEYFSNQICEVIDKLSKDLNLKVKKHIFTEYNDEFEKIIKSNMTNKIYILDIVMPKIKGTEIAKMVRENDLDSLIIFITLYCDEYDKEVLNNDYMFLKFIDKSDDYNFLLYETLYKSLKKKVKPIITIDTKDTFYRFNSNLVTHIYKDKRKVVICYGNNKKARFNLALKDIKEQLTDDFAFSKSGCIVNLKRISNIDKVNHIITFDNKETTDLVSKKFLKEIVEKEKVAV